jgi:hypothetical protein
MKNSWKIISSGSAGKSAKTFEEFTRPSATYTKFTTTSKKGGKSTTTIKTTQTSSNQWTNQSHPSVTWDQISTNWNTFAKPWDNITKVTTSPAVLTDETGDLGFLAIQNLDSSNAVFVSLEGNDAAKYYIIVKAGSTAAFECTNSAIECSEVYVKSLATLNIKYIIARAA